MYIAWLTQPLDATKNRLFFLWFTSCSPNKLLRPGIGKRCKAFPGEPVCRVNQSTDNCTGQSVSIRHVIEHGPEIGGPQRFLERQLIDARDRNVDTDTAVGFWF